MFSRQNRKVLILFIGFIFSSFLFAKDESLKKAVQLVQEGLEKSKGTGVQNPDCELKNPSEENHQIVLSASSATPTKSLGDYKCAGNLTPEECRIAYVKQLTPKQLEQMRIKLDEMSFSKKNLSNWKLVWNEEFDVPGLPDQKNWSYDTSRNKQGWYNNEKQYYSANRLENAEVKDGKLVITARKEALSSAEDWGGQQYTSARLLTDKKAQWTYGFFEVRAKIPCGLGTWPAIWMLGSGDKPWPTLGEIDIMEHVGRAKGNIYGTLHSKAHNSGGAKSKKVLIGDVCENFHNYQVLWTPDKMTFGVDDIKYHEYANPKTGDLEWPFHTPQYLILNIAVGGDFAGKKIDDSVFPAKMEIEYIHVYQTDDKGNTKSNFKKNSQTGKPKNP